MLPRNANKAHLSGKICKHAGSFVRLSAFKITSKAIVAHMVNF